MTFCVMSEVMMEVGDGGWERDDPAAALRDRGDRRRARRGPAAGDRLAAQAEPGHAAAGRRTRRGTAVGGGHDRTLDRGDPREARPGAAGQWPSLATVDQASRPAGVAA